jgi:hypothetical protein
MLAKQGTCLRASQSSIAPLDNYSAVPLFSTYLFRTRHRFRQGGKAAADLTQRCSDSLRIGSFLTRHSFSMQLLVSCARDPLNI